MIEEFIEFCRSKGDASYDYLNCEGCAFAQFLVSSGMSTNPVVGGETWTEGVSGPYHDIPGHIQDSLMAHPRTFAGIVARYEEQK